MPAAVVTLIKSLRFKFMHVFLQPPPFSFEVVFSLIVFPSCEIWLEANACPYQSLFTGTSLWETRVA
jgi:hypothetical protein